MRVLFFMRSVNYGRHFQSVLRTMLENGHELHIALDRHRKGIKSDDGVLRELKAEFPGQLTWALAERRRSPDWESFVGSMRLGIDYLRYRGPWFEDADLLRERARHRAPKGIVRLAEMPVVGGSHGRRALERVLRHLEAAVPIDVGLLEEVRRRDPAVVLVSPLVSLGSAQGDAVRAARAAGVPIALLVASWDNLTNKGVIRDDPDLTLVWNHAQVREGVELHGLREETIVAIGAHTYDHWFDWQPSRDRQAFCEAVGLDPDRPFILYAGSTSFIAPDEPRFVAEWVARLRSSSHPALRDCGVLIRPHPVNTHGWEDAGVMEPGRTAIYPREGAIPTSTESKRDYYDSIHHSRAVVGINTSALIESAVVGRGVYTLITDTYRDSQEGTLHFAHLKELLNTARSWEEHHAQLSAVLEDACPEAQRIGEFLQRFVRPNGIDVPATGAAVASIEDLARRGAPERNRPVTARMTRAALRGPVFVGSVLSARRRRHKPVSTKRWAPPLPGAPLRLLVIVHNRKGFADYEHQVRELADRGHLVQVVFGERSNGAARPATIDHKRIKFVGKPVRRRKGRYAIVAHRVRRATELASHHRWGRAALKPLRRLERAIPTDPKVDDMLVRSAADALVLTPPFRHDDYVTDYIKSAQALGIPAGVWGPGLNGSGPVVTGIFDVAGNGPVPDAVEKLARDLRPPATQGVRPSDAALRALLRLADFR